MFYCKFREIFKNTFSREHLWVNASVDLSPIPRGELRTQTNIQDEALGWNSTPDLWLGSDSPRTNCIYINCSGANLKITIM